MSFIFGGGGGGSGGGGGGATTGTQTNITREAPAIEGRKLALYDEAIELARKPIEVPEYQVAGPSPLEQQAFNLAGQTGTGTANQSLGIASILQGNLGATQQPDIEAFMNPYQRYVVDEVNQTSTNEGKPNICSSC